jgi:hypothetical protein
MSYPTSRGMNNSLSEGSTDGKYKKVNPDRDGVVDPVTAENRLDLSDQRFGVREKRVKVTPDGLLHVTPNYVDNPTIQGVDAY